METNVPGVYAVTGYSKSYIIDGDQGVVLIDTGIPKRHGAIIEVLSRIGRSPANVRAIAITHSHADHVGGAAALKLESKAPLFASGADAPAIRGEAPTVPPPVFDRMPFLKPLSRFIPGAEPITVDHLVGETEPSALPADLRVIDTPGHTPGHVSYLLDRNNGVLFVGDAAVATKKGVVKRGVFNAPTPSIDASLRHLAEFDFDVAFFAHSVSLSGSAAAAFRRFAARLG